MRKGARHVVQTISVEASKQNEDKHSILPYCHRQASFKRLVQENPRGKNTINTIMINMRENSPLKDLCPEKNLINHCARKTVVKKLKSSGIPKREIKNITGHASAQGRNDYDSGEEREQKIISRAIDNTGPVPSRSALSQLYPANSTASLCAPGHVNNFSHCSVTLNIAGNDTVQRSTSDVRRGYKRIVIEESDSE